MAQIADWVPLGRNTFYRKIELYTMEWSEKIDLSDYKVAAAAFGGPIAIIKDDRKILKAHGSSTKPAIHIFSASGKHISSIKWTGGKVVTLEWSSTEDLIIVQDDGTVLVYDIFGNFQYTFSMGQEAKDTKIIESKIFSSTVITGVAVLTTNYRIFLVTNIKDPRGKRMAEIPGLNIPPNCWSVFTEDRQTHVLVGKEAELYLLDHSTQHAQQQFPKDSSPVSSYLEIAISHDTKSVALFTASGIIWIGSSDLQKCYCEFDTKNPSRPKQLLWCGKEAVVSYWDDIILVVGMDKDWLNYPYDSPVFLVSELDGVRIISNSQHELLEKVPDVVRGIFRIASMEPGAILVESSKKFQIKSHRADEYIRTIKDQLEIAVEQCIEAAGHEYQTSTQKMLLRAASFGKCFIPDINPEKFVKMCQTLRVLNAVRDYTLGIPLTYSQLRCLTVSVLIDRLILRRQYCLAIRICQYLKIPDTEGASRILGHWACYKVKQTYLDEEQIARDIANKLGYTPGISYADIANKASECGRQQLAIKLLDYEPRASEQVPLLMKLDKDKQAKAMTKAIESGDTDLIYMVILHLSETMSKGDFQMEIRKHPVAYALYLKYCKEQQPELLREIHYQDDNFQGEARCRVTESYKAERMDVRFSALREALDSYKRARNDFAAVHTEEQIRLMRYQLKLEEKRKIDYLDKSLHETMYTLLLEHQPKLAEDLQKEFKVPDKRFWWMKIRAFAEMGEWADLEKFSKAKKSPIGFEPFIDVCIKHNNKYEAVKYLPRIRDENKVKYYLKVGQYQEAANIAFEQKDDEGLLMVQAKCGPTHRDLIEKIQTYRAQLSAKR